MSERIRFQFPLPSNLKDPDWMSDYDGKRVVSIDACAIWISLDPALVFTFLVAMQVETLQHRCCDKSSKDAAQSLVSVGVGCLLLVIFLMEDWSFALTARPDEKKQMKICS